MAPRQARGREVINEFPWSRPRAGGRSGQQLYNMRCIFVALVTISLRDNKRFVSHGFCHCDRRAPERVDLHSSLRHLS